MLSSGLSLWGTQISPTLLFSTLFLHWLGRLSNWSASISCVSPGNMSDPDELPAIVLPVCLFEICPTSSPLTRGNASSRKHDVLGMPCCSGSSKAASRSLWPWQLPQLLSSAFQFEELLCPPLCIPPSHAICITSSSSLASEIPVQWWVPVDVHPHFSLPCLVLFSIQQSPPRAWILSCGLSHPKFHCLSFLDIESFSFPDKGGTSLALTLKGGKPVSLKMEPSSALQAAQNAFLFWFREGGNPSKRQQMKPFSALPEHHLGKLPLLIKYLILSEKQHFSSSGALDSLLGSELSLWLFVIPGVNVSTQTKCKFSTEATHLQYNQKTSKEHMVHFGILEKKINYKINRGLYLKIVNAIIPVLDFSWRQTSPREIPAQKLPMNYFLSKRWIIVFSRRGKIPKNFSRRAPGTKSWETHLFMPFPEPSWVTREAVSLGGSLPHLSWPGQMGVGLPVQAAIWKLRFWCDSSKQHFAPGKST